MVLGKHHVNEMKTFDNLSGNHFQIMLLLLFHHHSDHNTLIVINDKYSILYQEIAIIF